MVELIRNELGMEAELVRGWLGELTVWVDGRRVARRGWFTSPPDRFFLSAVLEVLRPGGDKPLPSTNKLL